MNKKKALIIVPCIVVIIVVILLINFLIEQRAQKRLDRELASIVADANTALYNMIYCEKNEEEYKLELAGLCTSSNCNFFTKILKLSPIYSHSNEFPNWELASSKIETEKDGTLKARVLENWTTQKRFYSFFFKKSQSGSTFLLDNFEEEKAS